MFKTKFLISSVVLISFMITTSAIKNKTRIIEKKISILNIKVLSKEKNINETQLDFFYLTSPSEIENRLNIIGFENYKPIQYTNIYFNVSDLISNQTKISNLKKINEESIQKK
mgnify:CR=1 FL=1|tara:strand:+ start:150 stop:488 length:339 start_codon:yes stop_codon:yes gene_type:complete